MNRPYLRRKFAFFVLAALAAALAFPIPAYADVDSVTGGGFAARASVLGLLVVPPTPGGPPKGENFTAEEPVDGFNEDRPGVGPVNVLNVLSANLLRVRSQAQGVAGQNHDASVTTTSSVADVVVGNPLTPSLTADLISSTCVSNGDGSTGRTDVVNLRVGGQPVTVPSTGSPVTVTIPGVITVTLNEQFETNIPGSETSITVNGAHITALGGGLADIILAQSRCSARGPDVLRPETPTIVVDKTAVTPTLPAPGGSFTFRVAVTNTSSEAVRMTSLIDDKYGNLNGRGSCDTPTDIQPGATYTCEFQGTFTGAAGAEQTDTVTATARDIGGDINPPVTASDSATVRITAPGPDVPAIQVDKTASPESLPAPGGAFTFNVRVSNTGAEEVRLLTLTDNVYGNLSGKGTCAAPVNIAVGGAYACSFTGSFTGAAGASQTDTVTATARDTDGDNNQVTDTDDATVRITPRIGDVPAISVDKTASPETLPAPGGNFTFNVRVTNTGAEEVRLTSLTDDVYGNLSGKGTCAAPVNIPVGGAYACSFTGSFTGAAGASQTDTVTATATDTDGDNNQVTDTDSATVAIRSAGAAIRVEKDANPTSRPEPGGRFTFTVRVINTGSSPETIVSIVDDRRGNLATRAGSTCGALIGTTLAPGAAASCTFTVDFFGEAGDTETDRVTVVADGSRVVASDTATITITDSPPVIRVAKDAAPLSRPEPGGTFRFRVAVGNAGPEAVVITSLTDNIYGNLNGKGTCAVGVIVDPGRIYLCEFDGNFTGSAGASQTDIVTVTAVDNEATAVTAQDNATVSITARGTGVVNPPSGGGNPPVAGPGAIVINNTSTSTSSATASAGAAGVSAAGNVLARTGQDTLRLAALAAALMMLGFMLTAAEPRPRPEETEG